MPCEISYGFQMLASILLKRRFLSKSFEYITSFLDTKPNQLLEKNCSDIFLAFYVLIILSPSIIIHVLWSFVDNYGSILLQTPNQQYVEVEKSCGPIKPVWYAYMFY